MHQHHENGDGSGHPWGLPLKSIHPRARVVRIIDSYESVTSQRPWRPGLSPKEALWAMRREWQQSRVYDKTVLMAFVKFLVGA